MPQTSPVLRFEFASQEHFLDEYRTNISNGGIFVATEAALEVHDTVCVQIALTYCQKRISLVGEVVHRVSSELAVSGAEPGVAVQLAVPVGKIRESFQPFVGSAEPSETSVGAGRRNASRTPARLRARVRIAGQGAGCSVEDSDVRTRNLSSAGVLISCGSEPLPVSQTVSLVLSHPSDESELAIDGTVVRHLESSSGRVAAVGIAFHISAHNQREVSEFVDVVRAHEHSRSLGLISGPIEQVGLEPLISSFAACSPRGTLRVQSEVEEGVISFLDGRLHSAVLGGASGAKALARMLGWEEGRFEFRPDIDRAEASAGTTALDEALAQAREFLDESSGIDLLRHLPNAQLELGVGAFDSDLALSKTEQAILDLAVVEMTLGKVVDVIPESDATICAVVRRLVRRGVIVLVE